MKIAITGGTGLIGSALCQRLEKAGHACLIISRTAGAGRIVWDPAKGEVDRDALIGVDAVVNLAGKNIGQRWSDATKREIRESRVEGTTLLARTLASLETKPAVLVSGSAIGYYGSQREGELTEDAASGEGFLAEVCQEWEAATAPAEEAGIRTVHLRTGVVLSPDGGALAKLLPPFKAGIGGPIGDGKMVMSWIALDDVAGLIYHAIKTEGLSGALNATAPNPVANAEFAKALGGVLGKPSAVPTPAFALKLAFGEMAEETILSSACVLPAKAQSSGYTFAYPDLKPALEHLLT